MYYYTHINSYMYVAERMTVMSFKDVLVSACGVYARAMNKTEEKIMSTCGSDRAIDEVVGDYSSRGWTSVKRASGVVVEKVTAATSTVVGKVKAPMVVAPKTKTTKDILNDMAQDEALAAALQYVYMNPCIKVTVTDIKPDVVNCDGRAPMVYAGRENNAARKAGACTQGRKPASMSMGARLRSFVAKGVSTPLVTVS